MHIPPPLLPPHKGEGNAELKCLAAYPPLSSLRRQGSRPECPKMLALAALACVALDPRFREDDSRECRYVRHQPAA
ncbi:MAG: hypothetical protein ACJAZW_000377 [Maritalea sp.]|jgi:hypothetical protein